MDAANADGGQNADNTAGLENDAFEHSGELSPSPLRWLKSNQGCQMVYFQSKNPNLGKFWRALCKLENVDPFNGHLEYCTDILNSI
jgi:hypothetical protein